MVTGAMEHIPDQRVHADCPERARPWTALEDARAQPAENAELAAQVGPSQGEEVDGVHHVEDR
eukprot:4208633-Pyramimonas_sp.AAC.1